MGLSVYAPWHKASYGAFLSKGLPQWLKEWLPLRRYQVQSTSAMVCTIRFTLVLNEKNVELVYEHIPQPDEQGIFILDGQRFVVPPYATSDDLAHADIVCVGEQVLQHIQERCIRLQTTDFSAMDAASIQKLFPLADEMRNFFLVGPRQKSSMVQRLDEMNWLATQQHLRRIYIKNRVRLFTPAHMGRVCPFETPEGPNIARIFPIALGATIRDGTLLVEDQRPERALGLGAAMVPLLEHDHPRCLLMGTNMMRQWLQPPTYEPAFVQSGNEPEAEEFWCGRNLLTAFTTWGGDTFDNGVLISESCAQRFQYPQAIEPGDKISNRHGIKGVVSRIVPDCEMPHLLDGTAVEIVYNIANIHVRGYFGAIREAVLGRVAHTEGKPWITPPFHTPSEKELQMRLRALGLSEDGMEHLTMGQGGVVTTMPCTVGWVYWGRLHHMAGEKITPWLDEKSTQRAGELEYFALKKAQAYTIIHELYTLRAIDSDTARVAKSLPLSSQSSPLIPPSPLNTAKGYSGGGECVEQERGATEANSWLRELDDLDGVAPQFRSLVSQLAVMGVHVELTSENKLAFSLLSDDIEQLDVWLEPMSVQFSANYTSSARAVVAPDVSLSYQEVSIPEEMAWKLFAPRLREELGEEVVQTRNEQVQAKLQEVMQKSWLILNRAPSLAPWAFIACRPVCNTDRVVRMHPMVSRLLQADFDGDQVSVFLPVTVEGQREAEEKLTVLAHLQSSPELLKVIVPGHEVMYGLASKGLQRDGQQALSTLFKQDIRIDGTLLHQNQVLVALREAMYRNGLEQTLPLVWRVIEQGMQWAMETGLAIGPFVGQSVTLPVLADDTWQSDFVLQQIEEEFASATQYSSADIGSLLVLTKSGAVGDIRNICDLVAMLGNVVDVYEQPIVVRYGFRQGLDASTLFALAVSARESFALVLREWEQAGQEIRTREADQSFTVLQRAMRAAQPGIVFAHAAKTGEVDPLCDMDSRVFIGLKHE